MLDAALECGATLVHPGWGFLAEDEDFARATQALGLTFVGPPPAVLALAGDKAGARRLAASAGVPVLDGYDEEDQSDEAIARASAAIGYPVIVKPAAGGGGKGMVVVTDPHRLPDALASSRRLAKSFFGDERVIVERYLPSARHVEVQIVSDRLGNFVHLGERDCSVQRRHQKVIEESPSPAVDSSLRAKLGRAAIEFARAAGYVGAGTCEFLVDPGGAFGFMEMNARLQVEHAVTEAVTGLDLVELQIRIARGEQLPLRQNEVKPHGHAIEARVYAEDPDSGFLPQAGRVLHVRWPEDARVDTDVEEGGEVSTHYDPMVSKIVVHVSTRLDALERMRAALGEAEVLGLRTNLSLLRAAVSDVVFVEGCATTSWLEQVGPFTRPHQLVAPLAAAAEVDRTRTAAGADAWSALSGFRLAGEPSTTVVLQWDGREHAVQVLGRGPYRIGSLTLRPGSRCHEWLLADGRGAAAVWADGTWHVWDGDEHEVTIGARERRAEESASAHLGAPMPGTVISVRVAAGDPVTRGQELVVVEAMKMEHPVVAPADGVVSEVRCSPGDRVDRGQPLVDFEAAG
jgi:acetyl/propionyl-CoA carboxylase alpha subunit